MTILERIFKVQPHLDGRVLHVARGDELITLPLSRVLTLAHAVAARLANMGIGKGDRVGVSAHNSLEAIVLDLAIVLRGAITAGIQAGDMRVNPANAINEMGLKAFFVEEIPGDAHPGIIPLAIVTEWMDLVDDHVPLASALDQNDADEDTFAIKFTSGSTGPPKGLEASVASVVASLEAIQKMFHHGPDDNILVFLPQNLLQQRYWIYSAFIYGHDVSVVHVRSADDIERILWMAQLVHPTVIMGVPSFYNALMKKLMGNESLLELEARQNLIQASLGGRIRYLWTGSAPIGREALNYFNDAGVPLYEGYGLNETCIVSKNYPGAFKLGSAGKVLPNKSLRFDNNSVIIIGSSCPVNVRYTWCGPNDNAKIFLESGEVYTGDIGYLDEEGFLFIQGRKDDLVVLSTGRSVLPAPIEGKILAHPAIRHAVLFGHGMPFLSVVIDFNSTRASWTAIMADLNELNASLLPEQRALAAIPARTAFKLENGCLGNQGKPVRRAIAAMHEAELATIYAGPTHNHDDFNGPLVAE